MKLNEIKDSRPRIKSNSSGIYAVDVRNIYSLQQVNIPKVIHGSFDCRFNGLKNLIGGPKTILTMPGASYFLGSYDCSHNKLTSLEGGPQYVANEFTCSDNLITNLHNVHHIIKHTKVFNFSQNPIEHSILSLCLIDGIERIRSQWRNVNLIFDDICTQTQDKSQRLVLIQDALIDAGFEQLARI